VKLPRHVIAKPLASNLTGFYYNVPSKYRSIGCPLANEPLGTDFAKACTRAETLNGLFDEWDEARKGHPSVGSPLHASAPSIGCFANTGRAKLSPRKSPSGRARTTSGRCANYAK
jgi:hypothetical protein